MFPIFSHTPEEARMSLISIRIYQSLKYVLVCKYVETINRGMFTNINTEPLFCPPPPVTMEFICSSRIYYRDIVSLKRL